MSTAMSTAWMGGVVRNQSSPANRSAKVGGTAIAWPPRSRPSSAASEPACAVAASPASAASSAVSSRPVGPASDRRSSASYPLAAALASRIASSRVRSRASSSTIAPHSPRVIAARPIIEPGLIAMVSHAVARTTASPVARPSIQATVGMPRRGSAPARSNAACWWPPSALMRSTTTSAPAATARRKRRSSERSSQPSIGRSTERIATREPDVSCGSNAATGAATGARIKAAKHPNSSSTVSRRTSGV